MSGWKFGLQLELNVRFSRWFRQLCILLNLFKQVQTSPNQYNIWCWIYEFMALWQLLIFIFHFWFIISTIFSHLFGPISADQLKTASLDLGQSCQMLPNIFIWFHLYLDTIFLIKTLRPSTIPHTQCITVLILWVPLPQSKQSGNQRYSCFCMVYVQSCPKIMSQALLWLIGKSIQIWP